MCVTVVFQISRFVGMNQLEYLEPLIKTRVWKAQKVCTYAVMMLVVRRRGAAQQLLASLYQFGDYCCCSHTRKLDGSLSLFVAYYLQFGSLFVKIALKT